MLQQDSLFLGIGKGGKEAVASEQESQDDRSYRTAAWLRE